MPPVRGAKRRRARFSPTPDDDQNEGNSHSRNVTDHIRTAEEMLNANRQLRERKRRAVEKWYKEQVNRTREKIDIFYENRTKRVTKAQMAQWDKLSVLLEERYSIETVIFEHMKRIEDSTLTLSMEISTIYEGRLEEILELNTTGKLSVIIPLEGLT